MTHPAPILWLAGLLAAAALVEAIRRVHWAMLPRDRVTWALATVALLIARQATVTMPGDFPLQYVGTAWLTLLLGYPRAVVSVTMVTTIEVLLGARPAATLGLDVLLFAVAPAWLMWALASGCRRLLPPNPFVFLIGVGFLGLFASYALPLLAAATIDALALVLPPGAGGAHAASAHALEQHLRLALPYALLLSAGEAWLEGMLTTLLVVFAPRSVRLFDEAYYLARR